MGGGAAAAAKRTAATISEAPRKRKSRSRLAQLISLARPTPHHSPLHHTSDGVVVGAAIRTGLLHHLRGAPCQHRNAVRARLEHDVAMLSVFAGHGKHGSFLAELAATVVSREMRRRLPYDRLVFHPASPHPFVQHPLARVIEDAFVEANIAVDASAWSRNSGATATLCLLGNGKLVVGTVGEPCVMIASRKNGRVQIERMLDCHQLDEADEKERVQRFGGIVSGDSVSDEEGRFMLPFTRSLGDLEMRSCGVCQVPTVREFEICNKDSHVIVSTRRLWEGNWRFAPPELVDVFVGLKDGCVVDIAEGLMSAAFGGTGPTHDATILCGRLR